MAARIESHIVDPWAPLMAVGLVKQCGRCGQVLDVESFGKHRDGLRSWCRACRAEDARAYRAANPEATRGATARYRAANLEAMRALGRATIARKRREDKANGICHESGCYEPRVGGIYCPEHKERGRERHYNLPAGWRAEQYAEQDGRCYWDDEGEGCHFPGQPMELHYSGDLLASVEHIMPRSLGWPSPDAAHAPWNLALSHLRCNISRGNRFSIWLGDC